MHMNTCICCAHPPPTQVVSLSPLHSHPSGMHTSKDAFSAPEQWPFLRATFLLWRDCVHLHSGFWALCLALPHDRVAHTRPSQRNVGTLVNWWLKKGKGKKTVEQCGYVFVAVGLARCKILWKTDDQLYWTDQLHFPHGWDMLIKVEFIVFLCSYVVCIGQKGLWLNQSEINRVCVRWTPGGFR